MRYVVDDGGGGVCLGGRDGSGASVELQRRRNGGARAGVEDAPGALARLSPAAPISMPDLYTAHIPVRWGDMDALGHVNNAAYLTYAEQARIEFLESLADGPWPGPETAGPILAAAAVQFKRPLHYPATVRVRMSSAGPGRTSFPLDAELGVEGDDETVYATIETTIVWVDRTTGRPTPLPDAVRQRLAS